MSVNILPGSLTVTGNVSTATAGIGGNLMVGGNITVTGNLYSANVTVSGGGGGAGVSSITTVSGITSSGSTGAITISAVVANVVGVSGIGANNVGGTVRVSISGALSNNSSTSNNIGGVILSNNDIYNTGTFSNSNGVRISTSENRGNIILQFFDANHLILTTSEQGGITMPVIQAGQPYSQLKFFNSIGTEVGGINLNTSGGLSNLSNSINNIGGVQLSNTNIVTTGAISNASSTSNNIGGVVLSNGIITPSNALATSNGYIRLGPVLFQWGYENVGANTNLTVLFPLAHSTTAWNVVFSPANTAITHSINNAISNVTANSFQICTGGDALNAYWQSIGPA